jgi:hypothetical protein
MGKLLLSVLPLKTILNFIFNTEQFQNAIIYLFMKPFEKVKDKNPALYKALNDYVIAFAKIPSIQTDDNPDNVSQYIDLFKLSQVESLNKNLQDSNSMLTKAMNATVETKKGLMLDLGMITPAKQETSTAVNIESLKKYSAPIKSVTPLTGGSKRKK